MNKVYYLLFFIIAISSKSEGKLHKVTLNTELGVVTGMQFHFTNLNDNLTHIHIRLKFHNYESKKFIFPKRAKDQIDTLVGNFYEPLAFVIEMYNANQQVIEKKYYSTDPSYANLLEFKIDSATIAQDYNYETIIINTKLLWSPPDPYWKLRWKDSGQNKRFEANFNADSYSILPLDHSILLKKQEDSLLMVNLYLFDDDIVFDDTLFYEIIAVDIRKKSFSKKLSSNLLNNTLFSVKIEKLIPVKFEELWSYPDIITLQFNNQLDTIINGVLYNKLIYQLETKTDTLIPMRIGSYVQMPIISLLNNKLTDGNMEVGTGQNEIAILFPKYLYGIYPDPIFTIVTPNTKPIPYVNPPAVPHASRNNDGLSTVQFKRKFSIDDYKLFFIRGDVVNKSWLGGFPSKFRPNKIYNIDYQVLMDDYDNYIYLNLHPKESFSVLVYQRYGGAFLGSCTIKLDQLKRKKFNVPIADGTNLTFKVKFKDYHQTYNTIHHNRKSKWQPNLSSEQIKIVKCSR